ncbi:unnamed protein product [Dracunculus medinensis]|uniref:SUI1 domain-containing protein n=1 Tax=Dracunculus medinensis TaxID=318479 RepID=A0A0N4U2J4_DRAME|nr:unnamed protein product [Dracunculus medinensis]
MFQKPFVTKSSQTLRNSQKRKLLAQLNCLNSIKNNAQAVNIKILNHEGVRIDIYNFDKIPLLFQVDGDCNLYPTVYLSWLSQSAAPVLLIYEQVLKFLKNGADLMLQGVIHNKGSLPDFDRKSPIAISYIKDNGTICGPVAIGVTLMSSIEMVANGMKGRGVQILHIFGDYLWFPLGNTEEKEKYEETMEDLVSYIFKIYFFIEIFDKFQLQRCFLAALKFRIGRKFTLPLDVGEFYSHYLLRTVPKNKQIDMKRTRFKKFSKFISDVNRNENGPLLIVACKNKGQISQNFKNFILQFFIHEIKDRSIIKVDVLYSLTEPVMPLFSLLGFAKGNVLTIKELRELIRSYIENLNHDKLVRLSDPILQNVSNRHDEDIDCNALIQSIISRTTKVYSITFPDGRNIVRKKDLPKINFKIEVRSGNKKVTLVNNLEVYGVECARFCQQVQIGAATSATCIKEAPFCEGAQILVQGNQIRFMSEILSSEFGIDKKYMTGLELIPKNKK